jgi:hypothetical protein
MNNVRLLVTMVTETTGAHRGVYQNSVSVMQNAADYTALLAALASVTPNTRAFYWYGHGSPSGDAIGSASVGAVWATNVMQTLTNTWRWVQHPTGQKSPVWTYRKPFSFVFLDGCHTGRGIFPEAFGILKGSNETAYGPGRAKRRAFMGWGGPVTLGILDNDFLNWSQKFWEQWLDGPQGVDTTLNIAINAANAHRPGVTNSAPMHVHGTRALRWRD